MASLRELLAQRVTGMVRRTAEAVTGRLRGLVRPVAPVPPVPTVPVRPIPGVRPIPPIPGLRPAVPVPPVRPPVAPAQPPPIRPAPTSARPSAPSVPGGISEKEALGVSVTPDPARAEPTALLQQLSTLQAATADLVARLRSLGYLDAANAILGVPPTGKPPTEPKPPELPPLPPPYKPEEEPEEPEEEPEEPDEEKPRYLLNGPAIRIGYFPIEEAWAQFERTWVRVGIGGKRDPDDPTRGLDETPRYGADAIARGSAMDPGTRIPLTAMRSRGAFTTWAKKNGYEEGLSIIIDGLHAPPGGVVAPMRDKDLQTSRDRQDALQRDVKGRTRTVAYWQAPTGDDE